MPGAFLGARIYGGAGMASADRASADTKVNVYLVDSNPLYDAYSAVKKAIVGKSEEELRAKNDKLKAEKKLLQKKISLLCLREQQYVTDIRQLTSNLQNDFDEIVDKHPDIRPRV